MHVCLAADFERAVSSRLKPLLLDPQHLVRPACPLVNCAAHAESSCFRESARIERAGPSGGLGETTAIDRSWRVGSIQMERHFKMTTGKKAAALFKKGPIRRRRPRPRAKPTQARKEIAFYRATEKPYGVFSNLYRCQVVFEDRTFETAEHAYQAGKPRSEVVRNWLLAAPSPALLAMAAHGLYVWDVAPDWNKHKFDRMRGVLRAKFTQHPDLQKTLISTGNARLVEVGRTNSAVNRLWGEVNGVGKNMLGVMLMELRAELVSRSSTTKVASSKSSQKTGSRARSRTSGAAA